MSGARVALGSVPGKGEGVSVPSRRGGLDAEQFRFHLREKADDDAEDDPLDDRKRKMGDDQEERSERPVRFAAQD